MADPDFIMLTREEAQQVLGALAASSESLGLIGADEDEEHPQHETWDEVEEAYNLLQARL